jgi:alpha-glucosidase
MSASVTPDPLWWQSGVVYQVYPRSFRDSDGDGTGDLAGVIDKLDYLSDTLGVDAIWLSPFYPSPMIDFGYDVAGFTAVDARFGDLATFDELVRRAHARDMRVIVDFVPNHSSDQHPWFVESRSSRDNPKRGWYVWADPRPDGAPPNNWLSIFGGPAWEWDATTGQYYLHSFLREQPDLNWRNHELRAAMLDVLRFWMERGVDGFRIDAVHCMMKDAALRDNPPNTEGVLLVHKPLGEFDSQLHVYDYATDDLHEVLRAMRAVLDEYSAARPRVAIGEIHVFDWPKWATYYGRELDELHLPFNFGLLAVGWQAAAVRRMVETMEMVIPPGGWPNWVLGNHDESRIASRVGAAQARVAMLLLLTLRGTPTIYYGDELGMPDVPIPPEKIQDPWGKQVAGIGAGRDPERTPMQWDDSPNAGFCPPASEPWLPLADDYTPRNVAAQMADPRSMLALTRRLLALRRASPALSLGSYRTLEGAPDDCFVFLRETGDERYLIALSFAGDERTIPLPADARASLALSTHLDRDDEPLTAAITLRAHEGCVIRLDVADVPSPA